MPRRAQEINMADDEKIAPDDKKEETEEESEDDDDAIFKCKQCGEEVDECDKCKKKLPLDEEIYCFSQEHFCSKECFIQGADVQDGNASKSMKCSQCDEEIGECDNCGHDFDEDDEVVHCAENSDGERQHFCCEDCILEQLGIKTTLIKKGEKGDTFEVRPFVHGKEGEDWCAVMADKVEIRYGSTLVTVTLSDEKKLKVKKEEEM